MDDATISRGSIVIRVNGRAMKQLVEGCWATGNLDTRQKITNPKLFMQELVKQLNSEDEEGSNLVHRMFDSAINEALEQGAEGIEDHKTQDA